MKISIRYQVLLLFAMTLAVYYPALSGGINSVDDYNMLQGLLNADPNGWLRGFFHGGSNNYYRPLLMTTFYADFYFWLLDESFIHLENILLHAINVIWIYLIAREVGSILNLEKKFFWAPLCAALIFAVHPINTEPVNWISGRTDLLAGFFLFPAVYLLIRSLSQKNPYLSVLGGILFLCACLSKETSVFFLPAGMFFCFWAWDGVPNHFWRDGFLRSASYYWSWIVAAGIYFIMRYVSKPFDKGLDHVVRVSEGEIYSYYDGVRIFFKSGGFYIKKLFLPWPLNFAITGASNLYVGLGVVFILAIVVWLWRHTLLSMIFLAMSSLLSSAILVALLNMTWTPLAERYLYLPLAFFVVGVVYFLFPLLQSYSYGKKGIFVFVMLIALFSISTFQRSLIWQDNLTLYQDTDRKTPNFAPVRAELGLAMIKSGQLEEGKKILKDSKIKDLKGETYYSPSSVAIILWQEGEYLEAKKMFWTAIEEKPRFSVKILKKYLKLLDQFTLNNPTLSPPAWINNEIITVQSRLYEKTRDPFWLYRQGKSYLSMADTINALSFFKKTVKFASKDAFYYNPAQKFVLKLSK